MEQQKSCSSIEKIPHSARKRFRAYSPPAIPRGRRNRKFIGKKRLAAHDLTNNGGFPQALCGIANWHEFFFE
jgi:hypothetical protein